MTAMLRGCQILSWGCFLCCSASVPFLLGSSLVFLCRLVVGLLLSFFCSWFSALGGLFGVWSFSWFVVFASFVFLVLGLFLVGRSSLGVAFRFLPLRRSVLRLLSLGFFLRSSPVVRVLCFAFGFSFPTSLHKK